MRRRDEIELDLLNTSRLPYTQYGTAMAKDRIALEVLLDIRDLLVREDMKTLVLRSLRDSYIGYIHNADSDRHAVEKINKALGE